MGNITYPKAEAYAKSMTIPLAICQETTELYGFAFFVLDYEKAHSELCRAGFLSGDPAHQVAMEILEDRFDTWNPNFG